METNKHTPEPWFIATTEPAKIRTHPCGGVVIGETNPNAHNAARIVAAVNACAGMADPAKEVARLKDCSDELDNILSVIPSDAPCLHAETGETVADYILGLQKEVGRVHALYFNTSQQFEAMREAIKVSLVRVYTAGYQHGHEATVEGGFIPVHHSDETEFHAENIHQMLCDGSLPEIQPHLPAK